MSRPTSSLAALASLALMSQPMAMTSLPTAGLLLAVFVPASAQAAPPRQRGGGARPSRPAGGGAAARPAGGGGRPGVRSNAPTSVNHGGNRANINSGNRTNINNNNVNINRNVNVNGGGGYYGHDYHDDWDDHWHPVATAAAVTVTAAAIGSIVRSVPPSCTTVVVSGASYSQCGSTWYQPQYVGSSVQYVVVAAPR